MSDKQSQKPMPKPMRPSPSPRNPGERTVTVEAEGRIQRPLQQRPDPLKSAQNRPRPRMDQTRVIQEDKPKAESNKLEQSLKTIQLRKINKDVSKEPREKDEPWYAEKVNGARIYQMTGFTTVEKIDRKFGFEQKQIVLRKIIATLIITLIVLIMLARFVGRINPEEFNRITGRDNTVESIQE